MIPEDKLENVNLIMFSKDEVELGIVCFKKNKKISLLTMTMKHTKINILNKAKERKSDICNPCKSCSAVFL